MARLSPALWGHGAHLREAWFLLSGARGPGCSGQSRKHSCVLLPVLVFTFTGPSGGGVRY